MRYSIITPVYNREDCVARCLDSVIRNLKHGVELEHIVVDDGSKDDSPRILQEYAQKHPHIKFIPFPQNRGTNAARNAAISAATGDFCIILDSDDYFVDDAMKIVSTTMDQNPGYGHYCFAADDMLEMYNNNQVTADTEQVILTFEVFLYGRIAGDFIHTIHTATLKMYPFDEELRIYEGVFFKRFYREAKEILFTKKIVTIRERGRGDSVTRNVLRNNKSAVKKTIRSKELLIEWFSDDLSKTTEGLKQIKQNVVGIIDNSLVISDYATAKKYMAKFCCFNFGKIPQRLLWIYKFRLGCLYFVLGVVYIYIKYTVFRKSIE